jgi:hypothetical protein
MNQPTHPKPTPSISFDKSTEMELHIANPCAAVLHSDESDAVDPHDPLSRSSMIRHPSTGRWSASKSGWVK